MALSSVLCELSALGRSHCLSLQSCRMSAATNYGVSTVIDCLQYEHQVRLRHKKGGTGIHLDIDPVQECERIINRVLSHVTVVQYSRIRHRRRYFEPKYY